jgi:hypothetical protein
VTVITVLIYYPCQTITKQCITKLPSGPVTNRSKPHIVGGSSR